jgi:mannose-1-phosphate guanylyltransferase
MLEAIILVGGKGTRLRPLTLETPKPMLKIAGISIIQHQINKLKSVGVEHIILATSFKSEIFEKEFGHGEQLGVKLSYANEASPLGTGGAIRNGYSMLLDYESDEPVLVMNGDILSNLNIKKYLEDFKKSDAEIGLHLTRVDDPRPFGLVPTDSKGMVLSFLEKPTRDEDIVTNQINAGCYIFSKKAFNLIPDGQVISVEKDTFPKALNIGMPIYGHIDVSYWLDLGTPASLLKGSCDYMTGVLTDGFDYNEVLENFKLAESSTVDRSSYLGNQVEVRSSTQIFSSMIMDGVFIGSNVTIVNSIIGNKTVIGDNVTIENAVIGDNVFIGPYNQIKNGLRVWNNKTIGSGTIRYDGEME